ncbi:Biopolymer transport protein ExbD [Algoriella xinjiangensis]|uniref:Biopolymer transport protein ExbD n=1 Tax=Algoriella xinjiangensis TaxID=684065 RepID=A0A1I4T3D8_9FLAO|nr:biopolymer transporter ExbD [Algoriella xinjiangensis]SFM71147.1 Biopolymer transport protein ExbD [Algoriella xinjiangensis]VDH15153.1 protein TolR [Algoriella xinjiangensis]
MAQIQTQDGGGGKKVRSKKNSTAVDMAPLVDLGFLLITFFMFAATSIKPNVMNLNMPPKIPTDVAPPTEVKIQNSITVLIAKDNKLFWYQEEAGKLNTENLNETDYSAEGIRKIITKAAAGAIDKEKFTVIIKPMDDASYDNLVNVLDEMEITKSTRYGIVKVTPEEQKVYDEKVGK